MIDGPFALDINECDEGTSDCEHECTNTEGSYRCSCVRGYTLNVDNATCNMSKFVTPLTMELLSEVVYMRVSCLLNRGKRCCWYDELFVVVGKINYSLLLV